MKCVGGYDKYDHDSCAEEHYSELLLSALSYALHETVIALTCQEIDVNEDVGVAREKVQ